MLSFLAHFPLYSLADIAAKTACNASQELCGRIQYDTRHKSNSKTTYCNHICRDTHIITPNISYPHAPQVYPAYDAPI